MGSFHSREDAERAVTRLTSSPVIRVQSDGSRRLERYSSGPTVEALRSGAGGYFIITNETTNTVSIKIKYDKLIRAYVEPTKLYAWDVVQSPLEKRASQKGGSNGIFAKVINNKVYRLKPEDVDPITGIIPTGVPLWHVRVKNRSRLEIPTKQEAYDLLSRHRSKHRQ